MSSRGSTTHCIGRIDVELDIKVPLAADGYRELRWLMNGASEGLAEAEANHIMRVTVSAVWQLALQRQSRR